MVIVFPCKWMEAPLWVCTALKIPTAGLFWKGWSLFRIVHFNENNQASKSWCGVIMGGFCVRYFTLLLHGHVQSA